MSRNREKTLRKFGRFYSLAFEMAIAVIVPILIGRWLDGKTGKEPWFTIGGMILGGAAAIRSAYRAMTESLEKPDSRTDGSGENSERQGPSA
jgi:F0F1-type ATP synthase assembly protein I